MSAKSNIKGRGLEYLLCETLSKQLYTHTVKFTSKTERNQERDKDKLNFLTDDEKSYYHSQSIKVAKWLVENHFQHNEEITVDRIDDGEGAKGNPTDIILRSKSKSINVSLKHNNLSLKHQRLPSLFSQLGLKDNTEEKKYRENIKKVSNHFYRTAKETNDSFTLFSELKQNDKDIIDNNLYKPLLAQYCSTLSNYNNDSKLVSNYFYFLIGNVDYIHVKVSESEIKIMQFNSIQKPNSLSVKSKNNSNYILDFDNGFSFNLRIHTASSRFENCSKSCCDLKIDTTLVSENIPSLII
jgi:hypothetical protein